MFEYTALVDAPVQRFTGIVTGPDPDEVPTLAQADEGRTMAARALGAEPAMPPTPPREVAPSPPIEPSPTLEPGPPLAPSPQMAPQLALSVVADPASEPSVSPTGTPARHDEPVQAPRPRPHQPMFLPAVAAVVAVALSTLWLLRRGPHGRAR